MKTLRFLAIAVSFCFCVACTPKNDGKSDSETSSPDSLEGPGVGPAPDNSRTADTTAQQADTTSVRNQ